MKSTPRNRSCATAISYMLLSSALTMGSVNENTEHDEFWRGNDLGMSQLISISNIELTSHVFFLRISLANEEVDPSLVMNF